MEGHGRVDGCGHLVSNTTDKWTNHQGCYIHKRQQIHQPSSLTLPGIKKIQASLCRMKIDPQSLALEMQSIEEKNNTPLLDRTLASNTSTDGGNSHVKTHIWLVDHEHQREWYSQSPPGRGANTYLYLNTEIWCTPVFELKITKGHVFEKYLLLCKHPGQRQRNPGFLQCRWCATH